MIVLIAIASVFAIALRGAVVARATMLEVGAIHSRVVAERDARAAVVVALRGIIPVDNDDRSATGAGGASGDDSPILDAGDESPAAGGADDDAIEIPDFLKELIPKLAEVESKAQDEINAASAEAARVADGRGMTGRVPSRRAGIKERLDRVGLPGRPVRVELGGRAFRIRMWDATGLLNVNRADEEQLTRYFIAKGVGRTRALQIADEILDWRDTDSIPRSRGAEQGAYETIGIDCRNGEILSLEELLFLPSMDLELFDSIEDELAIGGDGLIHVGSAPRGVLESLPGIDAAIAESIIALRASGDLDEESLARALPLMHRDAILERVRLENSGVLRLRVDALEGEFDRVVARFDGLGFITDRGVQEVGLRAM